MAKNTETQEPEVQTPEQEAPATSQTETTVPGGSAAGETQILTASTREELFAKVEELKETLPEGKTLSCGAVGYNYETALYTIQIDII